MCSGEQEDLCGRCRKHATIVVSRKEHFCKDCFLKFIRVKQRKQMKGDLYKVKFGKSEDEIKNKTVNLLFPFLFTQSSLVLADALIYWLKEQVSMSSKAHVGFYLTIFFLGLDKPLENVKQCMSSLESRYGGAEMLEELHISFTLADGDTFISSNGSQEYLVSTANEAFCINENVPKLKTLHEFFSNIGNPSSKEYFMDIVKDLIIGDYCLKKHFSHVVLPYSMSELAISTLSYTVGGSGERIGAVIGSKTREENSNTFDFLYPLRDVLQYEIEKYTDLCGTSGFVNENKGNALKSVRSKSMNELIGGYFGSIQGEYPEAVSTVVKIASKLSGPPNKKYFKKCQICHNVVLDDPERWINGLTVLEGVPPSNEEEIENLRRYKESSFAKEKECIPKDAERVTICYGCMVAIKSTGSSCLYWPTFV